MAVNPVIKLPQTKAIVLESVGFFQGINKYLHTPTGGAGSLFSSVIYFLQRGEYVSIILIASAPTGRDGR